ncbi:Phosphoenolpyruvate carboxykinase, partial [Bradyrhizobium sp. Rc3b]
MAKTVNDLTWDDLEGAARQAWGEAARRTLDAGLPVTGSRNGRLVRRYPDGTIEDLGPVSPVRQPRFETGVRNNGFGADKFGLKKLKQVHWNLGAPQLYQYSLTAGEAVLSADGALCADTGEFTGRSPKDKFTVRDATTDKKMWWAGNQSITAEQFETLYQDFLKHAEGKKLFAQDLYGGADPA